MGLDIVRAGSPQAAAAMLAAEPGARFLAGGTLVMRAVNGDSGAITRLVLSDGLGLDGIGIAGGRVTIGAAVTLAQVARDRRLDFLKPVATSIGGPPVRAMATVGGNLFAPYPYGDLAVALIALGAEAIVQHSMKTETVPVEKLVSATEGSGIVVSVSFAQPAPGTFRYAKVTRRHPQGASVLSIAAVLPVVGGKVAGPGVAYGAMAPRPMRALAVEEALDGKALDAAGIEAAVRVAAEGCSPLTDPQASEWYRLNVLPVHLRRLLEGKA